MKKFFLLLLLLLAPQIVSAGSQTYTTPGTYTFTVPAYGTLTVEVWGAGGGGAGMDFAAGTHRAQSGGVSSWHTLTANGGSGAWYVIPRSVTTPSDFRDDFHAGTGGAASGGDTNVSGASGQVRMWNYPNSIIGGAGAGGSSPYGGAGGMGGMQYYNSDADYNINGAHGVVPGGGGGGGWWWYTGIANVAWFQQGSAGGGGGGYAKKTYAQGAVSGSITVVVGAGGQGGPRSADGVAGAGGNGAAGKVSITWTDPAPTCSVTVDRNPISRGVGGTTLRWSSTYASSFYITNVGYVSASGSTWVAPLFTRTYAGTVTGAGGSGSCSVTLAVNASCDRNYGNSCTSAGNACGQTNTGTIQCNGVCSVTTPPASSCPAPTCSVTFDSNPAPYGIGTTVRWASGNATSFTLATIGPVTPNVAGSAYVAPSSSTSYGGTVYGINGATVSCPATLSVSAPPAATATITSSLGATVRIGQSSTITATFTAGSGDSRTGTAIDYPSGTHLTSTAVGTKTHTFTPTTAGTYTFYARMTTSYYPAWTTYAQTTLTVPPLPTCSVSANPNPVTRGQSSTLSWSSTNATSFSIANMSAVTPNVSGSATISPQNTTSYAGTATGAGGTASCPLILTVQCTPTYSCSGQTIQYTNSSCAVSNVTTCVYPAFCSAGSSVCLYPPISYPSDGHLTATPAIVPLGTSATIAWNVANVSSCTVSGSNGDSWSTTGSAANGYTSSGSYSRVITAQTTYTMTCTGLDGTSISETAVVNVLPVFEEN